MELENARIPTVFENPRAVAIAQVYADAFLSAASSMGGVESALEEYHSFMNDVVDQNPDLRKLLESRMIGRDDRIALLERVLQGRASPVFGNFILVLAQHDRLELLRTVLKAAQLGWEQQQGKQRVQVRSAVPLSEAALGKIRQQLSEKLKIEPILEPALDPTLLAGLVIRIGDTVQDSSLRTRLKQMRVRIRERSLNEIQSGRDRFCNPEGN